MLPRERDVEDDDVDDEVEQVGEARASAWADVVEPDNSDVFDGGVGALDCHAVLNNNRGWRLLNKEGCWEGLA